MKLLVILLFPVFVFGQRDLNKQPSQSSRIKFNGDNNIVTVLQGGTVVTYDLKDEKKSQLFLNYLMTLPNISNTIKEILQYDKKILELVKKIYSSINYDGVLPVEKLFERLEGHIRENEKLKLEINVLKNNQIEPLFSEVLLQAKQKLDSFDNEGYQNVLDKYRQRRKSKILQAEDDYSETSYLLAKNSLSNYEFNRAIAQIDDAIAFRPMNGMYLFFKAIVLCYCGQYDSSKHYFLKVLDTNVSDTVRSRCYSSIGDIFLVLDDYSNSSSNYLKALTINETLYNGASSGMATSYINYANLNYKKENYNNALEFYRKALSILVKDSSLSMTNLSKCYNSIGDIHKRKGELDSAFYYYNLVLQLNFSAKNKALLQLAISTMKIGYIYVEKGKYDSASIYTRYSFDVLKKYFPNEKIIFSELYTHFGIIFRHKGEFDQAKNYSYKAIEVIELLFGLENSRLSNLYNNYALILSNNGEDNLAKVFFKKAIDIYRKYSDSENETLATYYCNISGTYVNDRDVDTAIYFCNLSISIAKKNYGDNHAPLIYPYANLILSYGIKGDLQKAIYYFDLALKIQKDKLGELHPDAAILYTNIAEVYKRNENFDLALKYYTEALDIKRRVPGVGRLKIANSLFNISSVYQGMGNYEKAIDFQKEAMGMIDSAGVKEEKKQFSSSMQLGILFLLNVNYECADSCFVRTIVLQKKSKSPDNLLRYKAELYHSLVHLAKGEGENGLKMLIDSDGDLNDKINTISYFAQKLADRNETYSAINLLNAKIQIIKNSKDRKGLEEELIFTYFEIAQYYCKINSVEKSKYFFNEASLLIKPLNIKIDEQKLLELRGKCN